MGDNVDAEPNSGYLADRGYALSGKIMLSAIVVLFFVVILMFSLHLYARWYLLHARRRHSRARRRNPRHGHIVFYVDSENNPIPTATRGLDDRVLKSLPVFTFSPKTHPDSTLECAVCLSEFEENESGRILPKCSHSFHIECIDMWFHSHSTCPLCRTPVEEQSPAPTNLGDVVLTIPEPSETESGSASNVELCATCQHEEQASTSSFEARRSKLSIEVPRRNGEGLEGESSACESATSQSFKSPMSRMLSLKRILSFSRERRQSPCPSPRNALTVAPAEPDMERGDDGTRQTRN